MNPKVDEYLGRAAQWQAEMERLRHIALDCGLTEELKWRVPCYTFQNSNIVLVSCFKEYAALSFFKGALLNDSEALLEKIGENTQSGRIIKFTSVKEINQQEATIKAYIHEAIEVEKAGLKVQPKAHEDYDVPEELTLKLKEDKAFKKAFEALTPGRQRGYLLHFSSAKQSSTRAARIEKYRDRILNGKGFHDCVCGLSKKMPTCDGSHKSLE